MEQETGSWGQRAVGERDMAMGTELCLGDTKGAMGTEMWLKGIEIRPQQTEVHGVRHGAVRTEI